MTDKKMTQSPDSFNNRILDRNGVIGQDASKIMAAALKAVNPYDCVVNYFNEHDLASEFDGFDKALLIGFGKASVPMAKALIDKLGNRITSAGVVTKDERFLNEDGYKKKLRVLLGGHPIPTSDSVHSTQAILESLPELTERDLVLVLISGGGSALFTDPFSTVSLEDLQKMTQTLLKSGADIHEINTLRKHLDQVKGGGLIKRLQPAKIHAFILSDVIGDRVDMIASGPTAPDPTTYQDALNIIRKYGLDSQLPRSILRVLEGGIAGEYPETLRREELRVGSVENHIIGSNFDAALAAKKRALDLGYHALVISTHLTGLTSHVADFLNGIIETERLHHQPLQKPACLIFGGETTVEVKGEGQGGRNQDLALRMVPKLAGKGEVLFISLATDGEDGPTDAAGAVADSQVFCEGEDAYGMNINTFIDENDSYNYFKKVGGLIQIGSTGTNVNDLVLIMIKGHEND